MGRAHVFKRHAVSSHFQVSNLDTICLIYVYVCVVVVDDVNFALFVPIASFFLCWHAVYQQWLFLSVFPFSVGV